MVLLNFRFLRIDTSAYILANNRRFVFLFTISVAEATAFGTPVSPSPATAYSDCDAQVPSALYTGTIEEVANAEFTTPSLAQCPCVIVFEFI